MFSIEMSCNNLISQYKGKKNILNISWKWRGNMHGTYIYAIHVYLKLPRTNSSLSYMSLLTIADDFTPNCWQSFMKRILADKMLY